jgi:hypothetical protein
VVVTVGTVMAVMTMMTAAVHMSAAAVSATMTAAVAAGFSTGGERRQADNDRCGKGENRRALEHVRGSLV